MRNSTSGRDNRLAAANLNRDYDDRHVASSMANACGVVCSSTTY
jgi:hypothetical protein